MNDFFEQYRSLYENKYTIEAWILWISLWIQYIGYYMCFYAGFFLLLLLCVLPFFSVYGLFHSIKIKIKHKKQKKLFDQFKHKIQTDYISTLDNFSKKKKKSKK
jgi:hypothetical protein